MKKTKELIKEVLKESNTDKKVEKCLSMIDSYEYNILLGDYDKALIDTLKAVLIDHKDLKDRSDIYEEVFEDIRNYPININIDETDGFLFNQYEEDDSEEEKNIKDVMFGASVSIRTYFDKMTVVVVKLRNGFILSASSACVDKEDYDVKIGTKIALSKIVDEVWALEGYKKH